MTNSIEMPRVVHQLPQQAQDLLLGGDVERRGRLVRDHQARGAGERRGDQQPLPLAAGELVRVALQRRLRIGQLHAARTAPAAGRDGVRRSARGVPAHRLQQLRTDGEERVQRQVGILRNEADAAASARRGSARLRRRRAGSRPRTGSRRRRSRDAGGRMPRMARISVDLPQPIRRRRQGCGQAPAASAMWSRMRATPSSPRIATRRPETARVGTAMLSGTAAGAGRPGRAARRPAG